MKLLRRQILQEFKANHSDARSQIDAWEAEIKMAQWLTPHELKLRYPKASILKNQLVVFNISGNRYRLLVQVSYKNSLVYVKNIGTHKEYNSWDLS
jgi:mRNA interferase HigB